MSLLDNFINGFKKKPENNNVQQAKPQQNVSDDASVSTGVMAPNEEKPITFGGQQPQQEQGQVQMQEQPQQTAQPASSGIDAEREKLYKIIDDVTARKERERKAFHDENDETPEQTAKREKRERAYMAAANVGDALNAFHQAYSYARGTQPMGENKSLSEKTLNRIREAKEWRDKQKEKGAKYDKDILDLQNLRYSVLKGQRDMDMKDKELAIKSAESALKAMEITANINQKNALTELYKERAKAEREGNEKKLAKIDKEIEKLVADINYTNKRAGEVGKDKTVTKVTTDSDGETKTEETTTSTHNSGGKGTGGGGNNDDSQYKSNTTSNTYDKYKVK